MVKKLSGPKRQEIGLIEGLNKKHHNEEAHNLCSSPNIAGIIRLRKMRQWGMQHAWQGREIHSKF
jgi:hypothetical protein